MNSYQRPEQRRHWLWNTLIILHYVLYGLGWVLAMLFAMRGGFWGETFPLFLMLFWVPVLVGHTALHFYMTGRGDSRANERQAYADGFTEAVNRLTEKRKPLDADEIAWRLGEDGELFEEPLKYKRER